MEIEIEGVNYHIEILNEDKEQELVFLHGFTGSSKTWHNITPLFVDYKIILIDLLGHGNTNSPVNSERYKMEFQLRDLDLLFKQLSLKDFALVGYSMGGRVALAYSCTYSAVVSILVLESASPGLRNEEQRSIRRMRDAALAERVVSEGIDSFVKGWEKTPLFSTQEILSDEVKSAVRTERLAQHPIGLANSLLGMGTGAQNSYWEEISELKNPVLLFTGILDAKFTEIAEEMVLLMPESEHKEILAGHALHVEKPVEFATIVNEYLKKNYLGGKS